MNVADIQTRVKGQFGDLSGVQVTDDQIIRWINDGQREAVKQNDGLFETTALTSTLKDVQEYSLPADLLMLKFITYRAAGTIGYARIKGMQVSEFNEYIDTWSGTSLRADPTVYTIFAKKIILFPVPPENNTDALKIYYNKKPVDVTISTDTPEIPEMYHEDLVRYCLSQAYEVDEDFEASAAKFNEFSAGVTLLAGREEWPNKEHYPTITVLSDDEW